MPEMLTDDELQSSHVLANCCMNREWNLIGANSYDTENPTGPRRQGHACIEEIPPIFG